MLHDMVGFWISKDCPMYVGGLTDALDTLAIANALDMELSILPLRATDGSLVANVTYWGAVSASCQHPGFAYDFLRLFLSPEVQFGSDLVGEDSTSYSTEFSLRITPGWPVRTQGSAQALWENLWDAYSKYAFLSSLGGR